MRHGLDNCSYLRVLICIFVLVLPAAQKHKVYTKEGKALTYYPVSSIQYPVSSIQYPVSSIQHPAPGIQNTIRINSLFCHMPIYMDKHILPGVNAKDVANAHLLD